MPVTDGAVVLERLEALRPNLPVLVLTADPGQRDEAFRLGADTFLTKPFSPLGLLRSVESLLA